MKQKGIGKTEEDVLSYALFPAVAEKFLSERDKAEKVDKEIRELIIEDIS